MSRFCHRRPYAAAYLLVRDYALKHGSLTIADAMRLRQCSQKAAGYHIRAACVYGYLKRIGRGTYAAGQPLYEDRLDLIRKCVTEHGMVDAGDVMKALGVSRPIAHIQAKRAVTVGILRRVRLGVYVVGVE